MTATECADILRSFIWHREKMHQTDMIFKDENGMEIDRGKLNPETDILYQAAKFALTCVEEKI